MPPKAKFTREQITEAALNIIREKGIASVTARTLGKKLNCSPRPIFTVFENMAQVREEAVRAAKELYGEYVAHGLAETPAFKGVGMQYIRFAICEPGLFRLLFMSGLSGEPIPANVLMLVDENYNEILTSVKKCYSMSSESAERLYRHMWVYTHGIATLCATKMCVFTEEEISSMMTDVFVSIFKKIKGEEA